MPTGVGTEGTKPKAEAVGLDVRKAASVIQGVRIDDNGWLAGVT